MNTQDAALVDIAIDTYRKAMDAMGVTVKLSFEEVNRIVVDDLVSRYAVFVALGQEERVRSFEVVLGCYLSADELADFVAAVREEIDGS